jgi:hypothetical protein
VARRRAFLLLTICLSGIFWVLINATQTVNAACIFGLMWMPAVHLIPIPYRLVASLGIWIFGFGGLPNTEFVRQTADGFGLGGAPDWVVIAMFVVLTGTTGIFTGVAAATGEESAGAGLALPHHGSRLPRRLHASHNLWMQSIFTPLTIDKEYTKWIAGDLGPAFVVVAAVVAMVFWLKRVELPTRACG